MEDMKRTTLCYIENKGAFLMLYRNRKPGDANEGKWLGIGGKIEPGETPDECNRREVLEETGLRLRTAHFHGVIHFRADEYEDEDMYLYSSDDFEPADPEAAAMYEATGEYEPPVCSEGELAWISRDKVMDLPMWEGDRAFLRKLMDGQKTISMTLRYEGEHCTIIAEDGNMNEALLRKCEFFISNLGLMRETFKWDGSELHLLGSALLTAGGIETDKDELKRCERYIKDHTNLFSPLRGNLKIAAICHMIASEDPEVYFANLERAYSIIRITRRDYDQRYYLAAVTMADVLTDKEQLLDLADRANSVFDAMRQGIGAGKDMYVTAATIACSDISDTDALIAEAERCREILAKDLGDSSTVRELSYILALDSGDAALKCARLRDIMAKLEEAGAAVTLKSSDQGVVSVSCPMRHEHLA